MALLQETGGIKFSPWRCQLTTKIKGFNTIRLFLLGYAKHRVYADKLSTLEHIKTNVLQVMVEIPSNMYQKVVENYLKRINAYNSLCGGHLKDIVFHT